VLEVLDRVRGGLQRQPGLARTAGTDESHESVLAELGRELVQLPFPSDERG
jgi:hypothetical protein